MRHQYLSLDDPCRHITRMDIIRARLNRDIEELTKQRIHLDICRVLDPDCPND